MKKSVDFCGFRPPETSSELSVARVKPDQIERYAPGILRVMASAYKRQFEDEQKLLPPGSAEREFNSQDASRVQRQIERMNRYVAESGSAYWVAHEGPAYNSDQPGHELLGAGKTSPSRPGWQKIGKKIPLLDNPNCYVNDLEAQRSEIASALLYVALKDYAEDRIVVADVLPRNQEFFQSHGFRLSEPFEDKLFIGDGSLGVERWEAPRVDGIQALLRQKLPWLEDCGTA